MRTILTLALLVSCLSLLAGEFIMGFDGDFIKVNNIPLEMRNVPIHPNDDYVDSSHQGPILRQSYVTYPSFLIGYQWDWKFDNDVISKIKFVANIPFKEDMQERNYTNSVGTEHRGVGAALTFCELRKAGIIQLIRGNEIPPLFDIMPEISIEKFFSERFSGELAISYFYLDFVNGWDRWDSYSNRKGYILAYCFPTGLNMNFCDSGIRVSGGPKLINPISTSDGKITLKTNYIGWSLNLGFDFK